MRSLLTTVKTCWSTGSVDSVDSDTAIAPTPSWARPLLMDASQSLLLGAMLAPGFDGGRIPAADAGLLNSPDANVLMTSSPIGSRSVAIRRRARVCTLSFPLLTLLRSRQYGGRKSQIKWDLLTICWLGVPSVQGEWNSVNSLCARCRNGAPPVGSAAPRRPAAGRCPVRTRVHAENEQAEVRDDDNRLATSRQPRQRARVAA